jgi:hypothetical protein
MGGGWPDGNQPKAGPSERQRPGDGRKFIGCATRKQNVRAILLMVFFTSLLLGYIANGPMTGYAVAHPANPIEL